MRARSTFHHISVPAAVVLLGLMTAAMYSIPNAQIDRNIESRFRHVPKDGFVPDDVTASRIAEANVAPRRSAQRENNG